MLQRLGSASAGGGGIGGKRKKKKEKKQQKRKSSRVKDVQIAWDRHPHALIQAPNARSNRLVHADTMTEAAPLLFGIPIKCSHHLSVSERSRNNSSLLDLGRVAYHC
jgi:hypothetical protein